MAAVTFHRFVRTSTLLALSWSCTAAAATQGSLDRTAFERFLNTYVARGNFNGAVLVTRGGRVFFREGYGKADFDLNEPVTPETRFRIGSVSKSFTAAGVLLLVDRESVQLDAPVAEYIEEFPHGNRITVRQLLMHRSGLGNYFFTPNFGELSRRSYAAPADVVELVADMDLSFEPGSRRAYNNVNYSALAWLIEEVSGLSYGEFLRQEILGPLGMDASGDGSDANRLIVNFAKGYDPVGVDGFQDSRPSDPSIFVGAGSIYSTTGDLVRWAEGFHTGELLEGALLDSAIEFAWGEEDVHGHSALVVSGWDGIGYSAHMIHLPDENLTVVVLSNLNIATVVGEIALGLTSIVLGEEPLGVVFAEGMVSEDSLQTLVGRYQFGDDFFSPGGILEIVLRDGALVDTSRTPAAALIPLADGGFLYRPVWANVRFLADSSGEINSLRFYDRFVAERIGGP